MLNEFLLDVFHRFTLGSISDEFLNNLAWEKDVCQELRKILFAFSFSSDRQIQLQVLQWGPQLVSVLQEAQS